jgi:hypothetical protein
MDQEGRRAKDECKDKLSPYEAQQLLGAKVNALRELQSVSGEELSALVPSIRDKAFKGEL